MSEVVVRTPAQELVARVRNDEFVEQIKMALPENVPASRFVRATATALLNDPKLANGDLDSFFVALLRCAQSGLLPDGREAAIVRYGEKAQFLAMIGGIRKTAAEFGWSIDTKVVRGNDEFEVELGMEPRLVHRPAMGDRGPLTHAYAVARHRDGRREIEVMDASEIGKVRKASRAGSRGPWVDWEERMWEKSVGHRIFKRLPLDPGDKRVALIVDAEVLGPDESARMLYGPSGAPVGRVREIEQTSDPGTGSADEASPLGGGAGAEEDTPDGGNAPADDGGVNEAAAVRPAGDPGEPAAAAPPAAPGRSRKKADPEPAAPPEEGQGSFQIPDKVIDEAGQTVIVMADEHSSWNGRTVQDAAKTKQWAGLVAWLTRNPAGASDETVAAVNTWVQARQPELLEEGPA